MKKISILSAVLLIFCFMANAQSNGSKDGWAHAYEPRETWPFLYEEFREGTTRTRSGDLVSGAMFNITVTDSKLLYIKDDTIMLADMGSVYTVGIGDDVYLNVLGQLYKVVSELDKGIVLMRNALNVDEFNKVKIGYGVSSSTGSADGLQVSLDGRFDFVNMSVQQSRHDKDSGPVLPMKETLYLYVGSSLIPATQNTVTTWPGVDRKEARDFIKQEKIKWKQTESLEKVIIFLDSQFNK